MAVDGSYEAGARNEGHDDKSRRELNFWVSIMKGCFTGKSCVCCLNRRRSSYAEPQRHVCPKKAK